MSKDPYRYFRVEARELLDGLAQGALALEKGPGSAELVGRLLRQAHTLKGAARVVREGGITDLAHAFEEVLVPHRAGGVQLPRERTSELLRLVDGMETRLASLDRGPAPAAPPVQQEPASEVRVEARLESVRVEVRELEALFEGLSDAAVTAGSLARLAAPAEAARRGLASLPGMLGDLDPRARTRLEELRSSLELVVRELSPAVGRTQRALEEVRQRVDQLRLVPAGDVLAGLERAARDAAQVLDRRVELEMSGGEQRLDARVLTAVSGALLHLVRNAVAHGIEPEAQRRAAGKEVAGRVRLLVERRGGRVAFTCEDDGRGIDVEAVGKVAADRGLLTRDRQLGLEQAVELLMRGGVSTARSVSDVAGRGIGLGAVREVVELLDGDVSVRSRPGRGTAVELVVPISLASLPVLFVEAGGVTAAVPLDAVVHNLRIRPDDVHRSEEGEAIHHAGAALALLPLATLLGSDVTRSDRPRTAVVIQDGERRAALVVDRLVGTATVVVRPLPEAIGRLPAVSGATLDAAGDPQLVLDAGGLVEAARARRTPSAESRAPRLPILVIDDSLTTRTLEQSILETAGYQVELAVSAEEGLEKARRGRFGLFLVDVEMPGMDGYQFVSLTRQDPVLKHVPAILVTSLASPEARRRGQEAGARDFIAKGEFDQRRLLRAVAEIID